MLTSSSLEKPKSIYKELILAAAAGAWLMAAELLTARALAASLGSSIETWAGIIGATLAWSGTGALLSTKLANKDENAAIATWASCVAIGLAWGGWLSTRLPQLPDGTMSAALITSILLGPAALGLGALMPTATARATRACGNPDRAAGRTSAAATAGSVLGTLATPLLILPHFSTDSALCSLAILAALFALTNHKSFKNSVILIATIILMLNLKGPKNNYKQILGETIEVIQSPYQRIMITQNNKWEKTMVLNSQIASSQDPRWPYKYFTEGGGLSSKGQKPAKSLYLGGGPLFCPSLQLQTRPQDQVEVVEIDQLVIDMARKHFSPDPKIKFTIKDARKALEEKENNSFDMIFCDTYLDANSIPHHLATAEFFQLAAKKLQRDGVLVLNAPGPAQESPSGRINLLMAAIQTGFKYTDCHRLNRRGKNSMTNYMLRGSQSPLPNPGETYKDRLTPVITQPINPPTDRFNPTEFQKN